jgi:hypothetical protein
LVWGLVFLLISCTASGDAIQPLRDQLYFPTGLAISHANNDAILFVINANADLRYDSGTITPVDLQKVSDLVAGWRGPRDQFQMPPECAPDRDYTITLICDSQVALIPDAAVRIGNFATDLKVQDLQSGAQRLFVAVRGDPSLTWIDFDPTARALDCGGSTAFPRCDDSHRLVRLRGDPRLNAIFDEPFNVLVNSAAGYVVVSHLVRSAVSLADAPSDGSSPPVLTNQLSNLFAPDTTGAQGSVGVAGRQPQLPGDIIYVTSRTDSRVMTMTVSRSSGWSALVPGDPFYLNKVLPSIDTRGITFSADGSRGYVINRNPPLLHIVDTSLNARGVPNNQYLGGVEICPQASAVVLTNTGRGDRAYVGCFQNGQVWTIDPARPPNQALESIADVGRGPYGLTASTARKLLFVSNYLEDTVSVIDLLPGSPFEGRVALKIGLPRPSGFK